MSPTATATRPRTPAAGDGRRRPGRGRLASVLVGVSVVLVLALAAWVLLFSSVFAVRQVSVAGLRTLTSAQVTDAAAAPVGRPLLRVDLVQVARRTTQLPQVASAEVSRVWPNGLRVTVVERRPVLAVAQPTGFAMVDRTGVNYEIRTQVPSGVVQAEVNLDDRALLSEVGVVAAALPAGLRSEVSRVRATTVDNIVLTLDSGVVITWGDATESALKAEVASTLLERNPKVSIDVSSPHNPAVR